MSIRNVICSLDNRANRLAERPADAAPHDPDYRVFAQLAAAPWAGRHRITVDQDETTWLQVKFAAINTLPPVGKQKTVWRF